MMHGGVNFLLPDLASDVGWTMLQQGAFNDYPVAAESDLDLALRAGTTYAQAIGVSAAVSRYAAILPANPHRGFLIFQNNSAAGDSGTAPILYVSYDGPVNLGFLPGNLTVQPGQTILLDRRVPINAIFVAWGESTGSPTVGAVIHQGALPKRRRR